MPRLAQQLSVLAGTLILLLLGSALLYLINENDATRAPYQAIKANGTVVTTAREVPPDAIFEAGFANGTTVIVHTTIHGTPFLYEVPPLTDWRPGPYSWNKKKNNSSISLIVPKGSEVDAMFLDGQNPIPVSRLHGKYRYYRSSNSTPQQKGETKITISVTVTLKHSVVTENNFRFTSSQLLTTVGNCASSSGGEVGKTIFGEYHPSGGPNNLPYISLTTSRGTACVHTSINSTTNLLLLSFFVKSNSPNVQGTSIYNDHTYQNQLVSLGPPKSGHWIKTVSLVSMSGSSSSLYLYAYAGSGTTHVEFADIRLKPIAAIKALTLLIIRPN